MQVRVQQSSSSSGGSSIGAQPPQGGSIRPPQPPTQPYSVEPGLNNNRFRISPNLGGVSYQHRQLRPQQYSQTYIPGSHNSYRSELYAKNIPQPPLQKMKGDSGLEDKGERHTA